MANQSLPTLKMVDEALGALGSLFDGLPAGRRPLHVGDRGDVRRVLEMLRKYLASQEARPTMRPAKSAKPENGGEKVTKEEHDVTQIPKLIEQILALSHDQRREMLDELFAACCTSCAAAEGEEHADDCEANEDEDEGEDDGEDEDEDESDEEPGDEGDEEAK